MKRAMIFLAALLTGMSLWAQELPRLAVVEFGVNITNDKTKTDAVTVRNLVESQMVASGKFRLISRSDIDKMLAEQKIAVSAISSTENVKKLSLMNISYIVTGSLDAMGSDYAITVRVLDVSSGEFSHSANDFMGSGSRELYTGVTTLAGTFVAGMSAGEGGQIVQTKGALKPTAATGEYKIGDTGPGGGIVFYDKGRVINGWRYLEAAPAEAEFTAQWGAYEKNVANTGTAVGTGKNNTDVIVNFLRGIGESGKAAQLCKELNIDGYQDWFLPSKDELDLMYKNLKVKGLGGFKNDWYWSSSEYDNIYSWYQIFSSGLQGNYGFKTNTGPVRAVRAF